MSTEFKGLLLADKVAKNRRDTLVCLPVHQNNLTKNIGYICPGRMVLKVLE